jgi:cell division protein FtsQ
VAAKTRRWQLVRARRDAVPGSLRRVHRTLRRPRPRSRRAWLIWGVLAVLIIGALGWVVAGTSVLGVRRIEVTGSVLAPADQIRAVAAVPVGTPLARVDTAAVARRIRGLAPVADVAVHRSWPNTLTIAVTERSPVGVVAVAGGFAVLDRTGTVFNHVAQQPDGVALLHLAAPGPTDPPTLAALRVVAALTPALRAQLTQVVADSPTHIRLELAGGRVVVWGDADRSDVKATVATALLAQNGRTIDVSVPDVATTS